MEVTGYKYTTEQDAINAREQVDAYYGIPISPDDVTQNWTDFQIAELNNPIFWYIVYDISLEIVLGQPISFDVITEVN
jgi:hypothetical protein